MEPETVRMAAALLIPVVIIGAFFAWRWAKKMDEKRNRTL